MAFAFTSFCADVYRATSYDTPLWVFPNRRPGRWSHPDDETVAQYCAADPAAPFAELVRHESLRDPRTAAELRLSLWALRIDEGAILDLSTPGRARDQEVDWADLVSEDWGPCQALGRRIVEGGGRGVLSPNAALPGSLSLTLFGPRSDLTWGREPALSLQIPARELATGSPGRGVLRATRHRGDPFPADVRLSSADHALG